MKTLNEVKAIDSEVLSEAIAHQNQLTKPHGALGQLEDIAIMLAACQRTNNPMVNSPWISVFAADHGVTEEGVSAFPAVVTQEMVKNFSAGGAAITVLAKTLNASFEVVDVGVFHDVSPLPNLVSERISSGSFNFTVRPAMTKDMCNQALNVGRRAVSRAIDNKADLFIAGEMGIGNTTAATAIIYELCDTELSGLVGRGTGISDEQLQNKQAVIIKALKLHQQALNSPYEILRCIGGLEIAALTGAYLSCAEQGLPMVVDGVIACAAALIAFEIEPQVKNWMIFGHESVEPAQQVVFDKINVKPLLNLSMRLGEGSGAAMAIPIIQLACALHNQMATFEQAAVSTE